MQRNKKIILVSHCIINQNVVIEAEARSLGAISSALEWIQEEGLGILQLPCPEFTFLGLERPPKTYEEYNTKEYRLHCQKILIPVIEQLLEYKRCGYQILGILGVQRSPSCDMTKGVFMEELKELFSKHQLPIDTQWFLPNQKEPVFNSKENYVKE